MFLATIIKTRFRMLLFGALLLPPTVVFFETVNRFMFWETTDGNILKKEVLSKGVSSTTTTYTITYNIGSEEYSVKSALSSGSWISSSPDAAILYNPKKPADATIKYHHGQFAKMLFFMGFFGLFFFLSWFGCKNIDNQSKNN